MTPIYAVGDCIFEYPSNWTITEISEYAGLLTYFVVSNGVIGHIPVVIGNTYPVCEEEYIQASIANCVFPSGVVLQGNTANITVNINQGTNTENYKLVVTGNVPFDSGVFLITAGSGIQQIVLTTPPMSNVGSNSIIINLIKV